MLVFGKALAEHEDGARGRRDRAREGPGRPQGSGQDLPGRAGGRALRARRREEIERRETRADAAERARRAARAARAPAGARRTICRRTRSTICGSTIEDFPGPARRSCSRSTRALGRRAALRLGDEFRVAEHADAARRARAPARSTPAQRVCRDRRSGADGRARRAASAGARRCRARAAPSRARTSSSGGPSRFSPGVSSTQGSRCERRAREERGAAVLAELALADVRVAVAVGAERRLRVVEVQRADAAAPELAAGLAQHRVHRRGRADVIAGGEQVAGVQADAEARSPPAASISAASSSKERPSVPPAPAVFSRCSSQPSLSASASAIVAPARAIAGADVARLGRAGVQHDAAAPIALPTRSEWVSEVSDFARMSGSSLAQLSR